MGFTPEEWIAGGILIVIFTIIVGIPCLGVGILGVDLINHIGHYPSKCARKQMSVCLKLLGIEIFSFVLLGIFYHLFADYGG